MTRFISLSESSYSLYHEFNGKVCEKSRIVLSYCTGLAPRHSLSSDKIKY